jgi:inhibitor of KinA sporulation pathway (predicted exonuclease)
VVSKEETPSFLHIRRALYNLNRNPAALCFNRNLCYYIFNIACDRQASPRHPAEPRSRGVDGLEFMNYVVFDLEWNQCPYGKARENRKIPFEIIEIGAVMLDQDRNCVETFHRVIRPKVYRKLHYRTKEIVNLTMEDLRKGMPFPLAVRDFLEWAGRNSIFCTWGCVDLNELQRNMNYYGQLRLLPGPFHYYDVQKLFSIAFEDGRTCRALNYAADLLRLDEEEEFHSAMADAKYAAEVFRRIPKELLPENDSLNVYQNPKSKTEEIHTVYNQYSLYISREFATKEEAMHDPEVRSVYCSKCGKKARRKIQWFAAGSQKYVCLALCPVHGLLQGVIRMRKSESGAVYVKKIVAPCTEAQAELIRRRRDALREKRRRRRRQNEEKLSAMS